jgi:chemotaxis protein CheX
MFYSSAEADMDDPTHDRSRIQRQQLVGAIKASVEKIFSTMIFLEIRESSPTDVVSDLSQCLSGLVGFGGTMPGIVGLHLGEELAREITASMLGMESDEVGEASDVIDAVGEITNMIAGEMKMHLQKQDGDLHLSLPSVILGSEYTIQTQRNEPGTVVQFLCENKKLLVSLRLSDCLDMTEPSWI